VQKAGLRAGGAFDAASLQPADALLEFRQVQREIVGPQAGALADGCGLGGLKMGVGEAGEAAMLGGELTELADDRC
jgi:hypothetical protein